MCTNDSNYQKSFAVCSLSIIYPLAESISKPNSESPSLESETLEDILLDKVRGLTKAPALAASCEASKLSIRLACRSLVGSLSHLTILPVAH